MLGGLPTVPHHCWVDVGYTNSTLKSQQWCWLMDMCPIPVVITNNNLHRNPGGPHPNISQVALILCGEAHEDAFRPAYHVLMKVDFALKIG